MNPESPSDRVVTRTSFASFRVLMFTSVSITFVLTMMVYLITAAPTITERFGGVDGAELAATALSGGVPHPSGYPTFMVFARIALWVFPGEAAHTLALLSAVSMAFAAACTSAFVLHLAPVSARSFGGAFGPAVFAGLLFGWSPRVWSQAIIPEVYAVYLCFLSLASLLVLVWIKTGRTPMFVAAMGTIGLGTGTHLTILAVLAGVVMLIVFGRHAVSMRQLGCGLAAFAVGCAIYLFLPLWGTRDAVPSWGEWDTLADFWQHVSGAEYRYLVGIVPWSQRLARISFVARDLITQLGLIGSMLVLWFGLVYGWNTERAVMLFTGSIALLSLVFAVGYGAADGEVYLMPWTWCWCVWAGLGSYAVQASLPNNRMIRASFLVVLLAVTGGLATWRYPSLDLHRDTSARDRAMTRLQALAPDALLLTADDAQTFGAWYVQTALSVRRDVLPIDVRLLGRPWYEEQLRRQVSAPLGTTLCDELRRSDRPVYIIDQQGFAIRETSAVWSTVAACTH